MRWLMPLIMLLGCVHKAQITTDPVGGEVAWRGAAVGSAPVELTTLWLPFRDMSVEVKVEGYRSTTVDLSRDVGPLRAAMELLTLRWGRLFGLRARTVHQIMLIPEHGPVGTWTAEEARRAEGRR
jgi:hypothetical protein